MTRSRSIRLLLLTCASLTCQGSAWAADWLPDLELHNPFKACTKDCYLGIYGGRLVDTAMVDIFVRKHTMPWNWHYLPSTLISGTIDRPIATLGPYLEADVELGAGKRFGLLTQGEFWGALYVRYKWFPWNDYVRTTIGLCTGLNWETSLPQYEVARAHGYGDQVLHYLSPEIALGLPQYPDLDVVARFHHRSGGGFGVFNHTGGGAQYGEVGLRYRL